MMTNRILSLASERKNMVVDWKIIGELTDKIVLGTEGLSNKEPRKKSRAILINEDVK